MSFSRIMLRALRFPLLVLAGVLWAWVRLSGAESAVPEKPEPSAPESGVPRERGLPFIEIFDQRDYRGHSQVWTGVADARGLLYFGNYAQILVYDGVQWDHIAVPGATFVRALALDEKGRLWVGGAGAIGYVDIATSRPPVFVSLADRLPAEARGPGDIANVLVHGDSVYFQSQAWLFRWRAEKFEGWALPNIGPPSQMMVINDELVVQNAARGWRRIAPQGLEPAGPGLPPLPPTRFMLPLANDRKLFGTVLNALFVSDGRNTRPLVTEADALFRSNFLFNGLALRDGRFVLTLLTGGAVILGPDLSFQGLIDEAAGLPGGTVNKAFTDAHGGLWLCLGDGIARLEDNFAATWFRPPSPYGRIDRDAFARFQGKLFLGVAPELRRLEPAAKGSGVASWKLESVLGIRQGGRMTALLPADDTLLIAAADGVYAWQEGSGSRRLVALRNCWDLLASTTTPGRFFAAYGGGIELLRRDGAQWTAEGSIPNFDAEVRSLQEDAVGELWAGLAEGGVARITFSTTGAPPTIARFKIPDLGSAGGGGETRITKAGGKLLFFTDRGLFRFAPAKQALVPESVFGSRFADGSTRVSAAVEDARGDLWLAPQPASRLTTWSPSTLGRATPAGDWHPLAITGVSRIGEIFGLRLERTGNQEILWAVGASGVLRVELDTLRTTAQPGATILRAITPLDAAQPLPLDRPENKLSYAQNSLRFRVAAPSLAARMNVQFETQLSGLGQGARHLSAAAEREFTHLGEGRYVFRARARADAGEWTAPVEFAFTILPPWWRTPWAWALWGVLVSGGVFGIVLLRTRTLRHRAEKLELTVAERTMELHARNAELTRLHRLELDEKISAKLAEEKTRLEMLRYQLNPHFLFNTLNSLYSLVEEHPTAGHMVLRLSEFCRLTLTRGANHLQTLGEEIQMLQAYLDIEKVRWGDSLKITFDVDDAARHATIPPFLLLPLVENAIKHGGQTSRDLLQIRIAAHRPTARLLDIEIANTGHWLAPGTSTAPTAHIGLENLRERLARSYPHAHTLTPIAEDGWVIVRVQLTLPAE